MPRRAPRDVVDAIRVLGRDATIPVVAALLDVDHSEVRAAVEELPDDTRVHVDRDRLELLHSTFELPSDDERERLHRRAAQVLHEVGATTATIVDHVMRCGGVDAPWVVPMLRVEATRQLRAGDQLAAIALLERALLERVDADVQQELLLEIARAEAHVSPPRAAERYREALTLIEDPRLRLETAILRARCLASAGRVMDGLDQLDEARRKIDDPQLELRADLAFVTLARHSLDTRPLGRGRLEQIAPSPSAGNGVRPQFLGELAYERVLSGDDRDSALSAALAAIGGESLSALHDLPPLTRHVTLLTLCWCGEQRIAERGANLLLARAQRSGSVVDAANAHVILFNVEWRRGDPSRTIAHADQVIAAATNGLAMLLPAATGFKAMALGAQGRTEDALAALRLPGDERRWSGLAGFHGYLMAAAWAYGAVEDHAKAHRVALRCGALARSMGTENPGVLSWREAAAHAAVALGMVDEAREFAFDAVERARTFGEARSIAIALRALADCDAGNAIAHLTDAHAHAAVAGDRLVLAQIEVDLARALLGRGQTDEARGHARAAIDVAGETGLAAVEHAAGAVMTAVGQECHGVAARTAPPSGGHLRVLGGFSLTDGSGHTTTPAGLAGKAVRVLAAAGGPLHIEQLADRLWDDPVSPERSRIRLRNVIARTRFAERPAIHRDGDVVSLDPDISVDAVHFEDACTRALAEHDNPLETAVAATLAYSGDLLPTDPYAEWAVVPRERLRLRYLTMCDRAARLAQEAGLNDLALDRLQAAIRHDPYDTDRYLQAAAILAAIGDAAGAAAMRERENRVRQALIRTTPR